jgi:phosphoribosylanthranilate isomerase
VTPSPRVKICGVTSVADGVLATRMGADLIGLNFYPRSPRFISIDMAREVADAVRGERAGVVVVGVFVQSPIGEIERIDTAVGLDLLQFHGDEEPESLAPFGARAIKAWRWEGRPPAAALARFDSAWGFLLDRKDTASGLYGGTGLAWDFAEAAGLDTAKPVLLAGGVGPRNVRAALRAARPWGVDVCSRVESAPGVKDAALLEALFREIRDGETHPA